MCVQKSHKRGMVRGSSLLLGLLVFSLSSSQARTYQVLDMRNSHYSDDVPAVARTGVINDLRSRKPASKCTQNYVTDRASGAFTRPGVKEILYVLTYCPDASGILYRDGKFQGFVNIPGEPGNVGNIYDLNGDGTDDLVFTDSQPAPDNAARNLTSATFLTLAAGKTHVFTRFDVAEDHECSSGAGYGTMNALVIQVTTAAAPVFHAKKYRNTTGYCDRTDTGWKLIKTWNVTGQRR